MADRLCDRETALKGQRLAVFFLLSGAEALPHTTTISFIS